jgi:hypothetical protein
VERGRSRLVFSGRRQELALVTTGVDIAAISVLAVLSGGASSNARLAFFLSPSRWRSAFAPPSRAQLSW